MRILSFKTNIKQPSDKKIIEGILKQYKGISKWSIDFESKDKSLRITGYGITSQKSFNQLHLQVSSVKNYRDL